MGRNEASGSAWEGLALTWNPEIAGGVCLALQLGLGVPELLLWLFCGQGLSQAPGCVLEYHSWGAHALAHCGPESESTLVNSKGSVKSLRVTVPGLCGPTSVHSLVRWSSSP